ncbi:hypothetical protein D3C76_1267380 [compost metagenome]
MYQGCSFSNVWSRHIRFLIGHEPSYELPLTPPLQPDLVFVDFKSMGCDYSGEFMPNLTAVMVWFAVKLTPLHQLPRYILYWGIE